MIIEKQLTRLSVRVLERDSRAPLPGIRVEAWDKDVAVNDLLGAAVTDARGEVGLAFSERAYRDAPEDRRPDVFLRLYWNGTEIRSGDNAILWHLEPGEHKATVLLDPVVLRASDIPVPETVTVRGTVLNVANGFPLAGLRVQAYALPPVNARSNGHRQADARDLVGQTVSGPAGEFRIDARMSAGRVVVAVEDAAGARLETSAPLTPVNGLVETALTIALSAPDVAAETWSQTADRLQNAHIVRFKDIVGQLASNAPDALFHDWDQPTRHALIARLDAALLDPRGVLRQHVDLPGLYALQDPATLEATVGRLDRLRDEAAVAAALAHLQHTLENNGHLEQVDIVVDLDDFKAGNPELTIQKWLDGIELFPIDLLPKNNLVRYRDYLRSIFAPNPDSHELAQLETRFHQDFRTTDVTDQPANKLVLPIVISFLASPAGPAHGYGLGALPPQGTKSDREYLDQLIALTGKSAYDLGLALRLNLERPDSARSNPVLENIYTLQNFYRDSYHSQREAYPIITRETQGKAPFFMQYEEWERTESEFFPENFYATQDAFRLEYGQDVVDDVKAMLAGNPNKSSIEYKRMQFVLDMLTVNEFVHKGLEAFRQGNYPQALREYEAARTVIPKFFGTLDAKAVFLQRKKKKISNPAELRKFSDDYALHGIAPLSPYGGYIMPDDWKHWWDAWQEECERLAFAALRLRLLVLPVLMGDAALAHGEYSRAVAYYAATTLFPVGYGHLVKDSKGWRVEHSYVHGDQYFLFFDGDAPYTYMANALDLFYREDRPVERPREYVLPAGWGDGTVDATELMRNYMHPMEEAFFGLRQANAMLEWADMLYRTDDASNIARARELCKAVLWLHGETPPIDPLSPYGPLWYPSAWRWVENPVVKQQKERARLGFFKVRSGVNYYGYTDDLVPPLRYRALREAADRLAALAKSAQQDYIAYMTRLEDMGLEQLKTAAALKKARAQVKITEEQIKIAEGGVAQAQQQVKNVQAAIDAKKQEIDKADSFFSQFSDYASGLIKTFKGLPDDTKSALGAGYNTEVLGADFTGKGMLSLGASASVVTGIGIFAVASYMTMSDMADAANRRWSELRDLMDKALPAAQLAVELKKREVVIANHLKEIAQMDADLASDMLAYSNQRVTSPEFWRNLAAVMRRVMRRYLDLGAQTAWLAERALAYELDQPIDIIRLDYFPAELGGVTGADLLQLDLAELEAVRIEGTRQMVPIKHTFSLVRDFPLHFGQLKQTGRCLFRTDLQPFVLAYPGTYGHRLRAVSVEVLSSTATNPLRGLLVNQGISFITRSDGQPGHLSVRPAEALPLSEFQLRADMAVYGLPNEMLLLFEGSGVETFWEILFPAPANPYGLDGVADIAITVDAYARYSPQLQLQHLAAQPTTTRRWILISGRQYQPKAVEQLAQNFAAQIAFDVPALGLSRQEKKRRVKNLALMVVGATGNFNATLSTTQPALSESIPFTDAVAYSNIAPPVPAGAPALQPPAGVRELNVFFDVRVDQTFTLDIPAPPPGADFSQVSDVLLAIEYEAEFVDNV